MVSSHFSLTFHSLSTSRCLPGGMLLRMRHRCLAHPRALFPRFHPRPQPLAIARTVALDDAIELVPVDRTEIIMAARRIPLELRIGHLDAQIIRLRHGL